MIAVTGATGHIGNDLVRKLLERGDRVRALVPPFDDTMPLRGLEVEHVEGDVLDLDSLHRAFEGCATVFHLAGVISIASGKSDLLNRVNVDGTRNVVEACLGVGVKRLVYTSSIHAIIEPPRGTVIDETCGFSPDVMRWDYDVLRGNSVVSSTKARRELGYTSRPLRESIEDAFRWLRDNHKL